jgi:hypothetical protein
MRINTAKWRGFDVSIEGATFNFAPIGFEAGMAIDAVMSEIGRRDTAELLELSQQSRRDIFELIRNHLIGWSGIEDENGQPVPFEFKTFDRFVDPKLWPALFYQMWAAIQPTEAERKNSSTASRSANSAPATSIAEPANVPASSLAESQQPCVIATRSEIGK